MIKVKIFFTIIFMSLIASPVVSNPNKDFVEAYKIYLEAKEIAPTDIELKRKRFELFKVSKQKFENIGNNWKTFENLSKNLNIDQFSNFA